ncbi:MAG TPA: DUF6468 domain-containing protein [Acetobacteraceae bacterium]|nr:DUF6468 domain-containing protein [Acetobacteraceae bacterium]
MGGLQWLLELALTFLLAATLFHALRLERALGVLKRDRAALEALVKGFNESTREAEAGIDRLRASAETTGRDLARQGAAAAALKDDLAFLIERAERMADRLDAALSAARAGPLSIEPAPSPRGGRRPESEAERELLRALRVAR